MATNDKGMILNTVAPDQEPLCLDYSGLYPEVGAYSIPRTLIRMDKTQPVMAERYKDSSSKVTKILSSKK